LIARLFDIFFQRKQQGKLVPGLNSGRQIVLMAGGY